MPVLRHSMFVEAVGGFRVEEIDAEVDVSCTEQVSTAGGIAVERHAATEGLMAVGRETVSRSRLTTEKVGTVTAKQVNESPGGTAPARHQDLVARGL
jgi:hypothetical protein